MKHSSIFKMLVLAGSALLVGCDAARDYQDLSRYMDEVRAKPKGTIAPLPKFNPYEAFTYSASGKRSPFDKPIKVEIVRKQRIQSDVAPDLDRVKHYLESFTFDAFGMVGTLSDNDGFYALLSMEGSVYRVQIGDYMGRNHGRIIGITDTEVQVIEVVKSGVESWVERPRTLALNES